MKDYRTLSKRAEAVFIEKKSKFIATALPVCSVQQANAVISEIRSKYWDASHNVYAYIVRETNIMKYSDDGEPSGTAGVPVLEVLKKENITDALIVVTRYFGGTLLGAGGLVRAYSHSAKLGVDAAGIDCMRLCKTLVIRCDYSMLKLVNMFIAEKKAVIHSTTYLQDIEIRISVLIDEQEAFSQEMIDYTNANVRITLAGEKYIRFDGKF